MRYVTAIVATIAPALPVLAADLRSAARLQGTITFATIQCKRDEVRSRAEDVLSGFGATFQEIMQSPWRETMLEAESELLNDDAHGCERADALLGPNGQYPGVLVPGRERTRW